MTVIDFKHYLNKMRKTEEISFHIQSGLLTGLLSCLNTSRIFYFTSSIEASKYIYIYIYYIITLDFL